MIVSVVGCGESAKNWMHTYCNHSVGVNDCGKFGSNVDSLIVVNSPLKFEPTPKNEHRNRLWTIISSNPLEFLCHNSNWKKHFPKAKLLTLKPFAGSLKKGNCYTTKTSTFVAITYAYALGASTIIIWGVDMLNHPNFMPGSKNLEYELKQYKILFEILKNKGVNCYLGNENSILKSYLPVYEAKNNGEELNLKP
jgi:hypothetical protein